ncbi:hypothetical protein [Bradyrhizobium sp. USDA 10063]
MRTAKDIARAVEQLPIGELARFRAWFETFDAGSFDTEIERDACAGKLDPLAIAAISAYRAGKCRDL